MLELYLVKQKINMKEPKIKQRSLLYNTKRKEFSFK